MPSYNYTALDIRGKKITGDYNASSKSDVIGMLREKKYVPVTINEKKSVEIANEAAKSFLGENSLTHLDKQTGSEDMAYYLSEVPGAIAFVGCRNEEKGANFPHHHPKFDIDEDSLEIGTELYVRYAVGFLK